METKKRDRSANFNTAEIHLLVNLVERHRHIIENKKTDTVTNKDKEVAWKKIENAFNSCGITSSIRSWKTLKLKYEGIKKTTKKKTSQQRQETYRTGGGPSNAQELNEVEEKVLSICSNIKGLETRYDSDNISVPTFSEEIVVLGQVETICPDTAEISIASQQDSINIVQAQKIEAKSDLNDSLILDINEEDNESQKENKWDRWHPRALKTRVSNVLKTEAATKSSVTNKLDKLSTARLELVRLQMETTRLEQQFIKEKHALEMSNLAIDERRKQEIHELLVKKISSGLVTNDMIV